jgi:hypothetical protein
VSVLYAVPFPLRFPYVTKPVLVTKLRMEMETPGQVFSYRAFKSDTKRSMFVGLKDMIPKEVFRDVANLTSKSRVRPPPPPLSLPPAAIGCTGCGWRSWDRA